MLISVFILNEVKWNRFIEFVFIMKCSWNVNMIKLLVLYLFDIWCCVYVILIV